jgi:hypothetical protein
MSIQEKAVITRFNVSAWTARRYDRKVTQKIEDEYSTRDAGRFNKVLIAEDAIKAYQSIAGEARVYHYSLTLPWGDNGDRLLPVALMDAYKTKMEAYRARFNEQIEVFCGSYPSLIEDAKIRLNGMFDADDYPDTYRIRTKFDFSVRFYPVPSSGDFRVNIDMEQIEEMKTELSQETDRLKNAAIRATWERLYYPVAKMVERLSKDENKFHDSLIGNVIEVLSVIDGLNFEENPEISAIKERIGTMLAGLEPDTIRNTRKIREDVTSAAMLELKTMGNILNLNPDETIRKLQHDRGKSKKTLPETERVLKTA